jgi:hypothetical protein
VSRAPARPTLGRSDPHAFSRIEDTFKETGAGGAELGRRRRRWRDAIILDALTGEILAAVTKAGESTVGLAKGEVVDSEVWTSATGWTDDRPKRPGNCRRV